MENSSVWAHVCSCYGCIFAPPCLQRLYCVLVKYSFRVREMATWGLSSLVSVTMSQWLTCRYVNSQLSGSLASQSFNTHNGGNWGKMGTAAKHCGKAGDRWPEKFHCFPFFFNFYDGMVIVGLWNCPMWKSDFVRTVKQRVQLFTAGLRWKCRQQTGKVTMNTLWIFLASNYSLHVCLLPHYF